MAATYQSCFPNGGLPACASGCPFYAAPTLTFPNQNVNAVAAVLATQAEVLSHGQIVTINHGTYYQFGQGSSFLHLGEQDYISYSGHPRFPISQLFQWSFRKYPYVGNDIAPDGSVPYASPGLVIREGDFLMLVNEGAGRVMTLVGPASPYNLPFVSVPLRDAISDFRSFGSMSPENVRIISETFDPSIPSAQQPPVKLDGTKAYFIQFTRFNPGQNLSLYPNQMPAPCFIHTSAYKGDGTRWILLPVNWHYGLSPDAPIPFAVPSARPLRPEERKAGEGQNIGYAPESGTIGALIAGQRFGSSAYATPGSLNADTSAGAGGAAAAAAAGK